MSLCPELNVSSFGDTPEEAVALFTEECECMGTLSEVLEEAGYSLEKREMPTPVEAWSPPRPLKTLHLELALA